MDSLSRQENIKQLLKALIDEQYRQDYSFRQEMAARGEPHRALGDSFMLHHLKMLKKLIEE